MLFILIPIAWLALATLVLALCTMAARGDAGMAPRAVTHGGEPTVAQPTVEVRPRRVERTPYGGLRARGVRRRGARSAAGS